MQNVTVVNCSDVLHVVEKNDMATLSKRNRFIWVIPALIFVALLLFIFKPSSSAPSKTTNQNENTVRIRIAVPDLSSSERHSSGTPLV